MILRCLGAHCAPLRDNIANGNISLQTPVQVDFAIEQSVFPSDWARACRDWLVQSHNRTATRVPARPVVDSLPLRRKPRWLKQPTGLFLRATFRIRHLPFTKAKKTFLLECLFALVEGGGFEPPKS